MARQGITEEQVFEAAGQLQEEGLVVTSNSVRDKIGTGSFSTINALLAKWREANLIPDMPNTLNRAVQQLWTIAWKEAQDNVKDERDALVTARRELELEYQGMLNEISQLETNIIKLKDELHKVSQIEKALNIENTKIYQLAKDAITSVDEVFNELEVLKLKFPTSIENTQRYPRDESAPPGVCYMDENGELPIGIFLVN